MDDRTVDRARQYLGKHDPNMDSYVKLHVKDIGDIDSMADDFMPLISLLNRTVLLLPKWKDDISKKCHTALKKHGC